jgi:diguanylate cyclase (GGDEF)-like protein
MPTVERQLLITAVLLADDDGFKAINNRLGHEAGDDVLKVVAARLRTSVREADLVGRAGGDEFVVLLPKLKGPGQAEAICQCVHDAVSQPFILNDENIHLNASIGITRCPQNDCDLASQIRLAGQAFYPEKKRDAAGASGTLRKDLDVAFRLPGKPANVMR